MKSKEVIKLIEKDGWKKVAQKGSHMQFKHTEKTGRVTIANHNKDIPIGTLKSIEKQAGIRLTRQHKKKHGLKM